MGSQLDMSKKRVYSLNCKEEQKQRGCLNARVNKTTRKKHIMLVDIMNTKIAQLREELAIQEAKLAKFDALNEEQKLATILHDNECHYEYCGWSFASRDWTEADHVRFVAKAAALLAITDYDTNLRLMAVR
jgi:hypothetical protein